MLSLSSAKGRIAIAIVIVTILVVITTVIGITRTRALNTQLKQLEEISQAAASIEAARADFLGATNSLAVTVLTTDLSYFAGYQASHAETIIDLNKAHQTFSSHGMHNEAQAVEDLVAQIDAYHAKVAILAVQYLKAGANTPSISSQFVNENVRDLATTAELILSDMQAITDNQELEVGRLRREAENASAVTLRWHLAMGGVGLGVIALCSIVGLSVIRPLTVLRRSAREVASGNLDTMASERGVEEVRSLAADFNAMTRTLVSRTRELEYHIEEKDKAEEALKFLAYHDTLTGLANRQALSEYFTTMAAKAEHDGTLMGLMYLDLDGFKLINDAVGHESGDELVSHISHLIAGQLREPDLIARVGGDEFALLIPVSDRGDALRLADRLVSVIRKPWRIGGREFFVSASMGIAFFPEDAKDLGTLMKYADTAIYRAKEWARGNYTIYDASMNDAIIQRVELEQHLRRSIEFDELLLEYQPQVNLDSAHISGVEALIRWRSSTRGLLPPSEFIPLAEDSGFIVALGEWVIREACRQVKRWLLQGLPRIRIAVNVPARQLIEPDFCDTVQTILADTGYDSKFLEFEITETVALSNRGILKRTLNELSEIGVGIAINDFGSDSSSLGYLREFPVDAIKIDGSLVRSVATDVRSAALVGTMVDLAHSVGIRVIAEGIESETDLKLVKSHGCGEAQGFLLGRPTSAEQISTLLLQRESSPNTKG